MKLCSSLHRLASCDDQFSSASQILDLLWKTGCASAEGYNLTGNLTIEQKLTAAVAFGSLRLVHETLPGFLDQGVSSAGYLNPVQYAVESGNKGLLQVIWQCVASIPTKEGRLRAMQTLRVDDLMYHMIWDRDSGRARTLANFYTNSRTKPKVKTYRAWLDFTLTRACREHSDVLILTAISMCPNSSSKVSNETRNKACSESSVEALISLLQHGDIKDRINIGKELSLPLIAAIRHTQDLDKIAAVLDGGADINTRVPSMAQRPEPDKMTPIEAAIHYSSLNVVKFLLDRGADAPPWEGLAQRQRDLV